MKNLLNYLIKIITLFLIATSVSIFQRDISSLSTEVGELKTQIRATTISEDVKELKKKFDELVSKLKQSRNKQKMDSSYQTNNNTAASNLSQHTFNNVVGGSNLNKNRIDDFASLFVYFSLLLYQKRMRLRMNGQVFKDVSEEYL